MRRGNSSKPSKKGVRAAVSGVPRISLWLPAPPLASPDKFILHGRVRRNRARGEGPEHVPQGGPRVGPADGRALLGDLVPLLPKVQARVRPASGGEALALCECLPRRRVEPALGRLRGGRRPDPR